MKPPSAEATRKALSVAVMNASRDRTTTLSATNYETIHWAAKAWSRIAPDADGEWPDEVVDDIAGLLWSRIHPRGTPWHEMKDRWGADGPSETGYLGHAKAVLAELVRLAEGSTDETS